MMRILDANDTRKYGTLFPAIALQKCIFLTSNQMISQQFNFRMKTNEHNNILDLTKFDFTIVYKERSACILY